MSIETVQGSIATGDLRRTIPHEHLLINMLREQRDNELLNDETLVIEELAIYRTQGSASVVDLSSAPLTQGTGHYSDPCLDEAYLDRHAVDQIASDLGRDLTEAIPGTDVSAGEIGSDGWLISAREERSFRVAARAGIRTGVGVSPTGRLLARGAHTVRPAPIGGCRPRGGPDDHRCQPRPLLLTRVGRQTIQSRNAERKDRT